MGARQNPEPRCEEPLSAGMMFVAAAAWLTSPAITIGAIVWWLA